MRLAPVLWTLWAGFIFLPSSAQSLQDDFEGNGTIAAWYGDDCALDPAFANPFAQGINNSAQVLKYEDSGGQYANIYFDAGRTLNLAQASRFSFKIYLPSASMSGNTPLQVSLKLQNAALPTSWSTQTEVIKALQADQWQVITVDFASDPYLNLDPNSPPPLQRNDLNRVMIQINGENNNDPVIAYIDDFNYLDTVGPAPSPYTELVWQDEFKGQGPIDTSKWFHQTLLPLGNSWYNGEIQHYTNREANSHQANGALQLIAKKESFTDQGHTKQYTSARLNSKFSFRYGRVVVRAKMPRGHGTWPAIWTLGTSIIEPGAYYNLQGQGTQLWPACGEIDIIEHWGRQQNYVSSATHTPSSFGNTVNVGGRTLASASSAFHDYELEWSPQKLVFSIDGQVHFVYQPSQKDANTWPFDSAQYLLLNFAIEPSIDPNFSQDTLEVDYVRIYQKPILAQAENTAPSALALFPNPVAGDRLQVSLPSDAREGQLRIYSAAGSLMLSREGLPAGPYWQLEGIGDWPAGLYFIYLSTAEQAYQARFFKR